MAIELMTIGALSGLGMTKLCSIISIILTGARIPLAMLLTHVGMGLDGIWWALSLTSIVKGYCLYTDIPAYQPYKIKIIFPMSGTKRTPRK